MTTSILKQIAQIKKLPLDGLRERWTALFGTEAPAYSRSFMERRLIHRLQEIQHGGLSNQTNERIRETAAQHHLDEMAAPPRQAMNRKGAPVIGTRLTHTSTLMTGSSCCRDRTGRARRRRRP